MECKESKNEPTQKSSSTTQTSSTKPRTSNSTNSIDNTIKSKPTNPQKCDRLPYYCTEPVQSVVELLDGYIDKNWDGLQANLKEQYWQNDTQKNTPAALNQLIRDASTLDLSVYVLKYTSITKALIANNEMSTMQRCR